MVQYKVRTKRALRIIQTSYIHGKPIKIQIIGGRGIIEFEGLDEKYVQENIVKRLGLEITEINRTEENNG